MGFPWFHVDITLCTFSLWIKYEETNDDRLSVSSGIEKSLQRNFYQSRHSQAPLLNLALVKHTKLEDFR